MRGDLCPYDHGMDPVVLEDVELSSMLNYSRPPPGAPPVVPPVNVGSLPPPPHLRAPPPSLPPPGTCIRIRVLINFFSNEMFLQENRTILTRPESVGLRHRSVPELHHPAHP